MCMNVQGGVTSGARGALLGRERFISESASGRFIRGSFISERQDDGHTIGKVYPTSFILARTNKYHLMWG